MASKPYDSTSRNLVGNRPGDWLALAGHVVRGPVRLVEGNLATVNAEADQVLRVDGPEPWLAHLELQTSRDSTLPRRLLRYNVLLDHHHNLPTRSVAILLRRQADGAELSGTLEIRRAGMPPHLSFSYDVIRVWTLSVDALLAGGLGTLPLAPIADLGHWAPQDVIGRMEDRIRRDASDPEAAMLWDSTMILMGLRYPAATAELLLRGVRNMRDSTTYQAIYKRGHRKGRQKGIEKGIQAEARHALLAIGRKRLGEPSPEILDAIEQIQDTPRLNALLLATVDAKCWDDLTPHLTDHTAG